MTERVRYSSAPIMGWSSGDFRFNKGVLDLTPKQEEVFKEVLSKIPPRYKSMIRRLGTVSEVEAAQMLINEVPAQAIQGAAHTGLLKDKDDEIRELKEKLAIFEAKNFMAVKKEKPKESGVSLAELAVKTSTEKE